MSSASQLQGTWMHRCPVDRNGVPVRKLSLLTSSWKRYCAWVDGGFLYYDEFFPEPLPDGSLPGGRNFVALDDIGDIEELDRDEMRKLGSPERFSFFGWRVALRDSDDSGDRQSDLEERLRDGSIARSASMTRSSFNSVAPSLIDKGRGDQLHRRAFVFGCESAGDRDAWVLGLRSAAAATYEVNEEHIQQLGFLQSKEIDRRSKTENDETATFEKMMARFESFFIVPPSMEEVEDIIGLTPTNLSPRPQHPSENGASSRALPAAAKTNFVGKNGAATNAHNLDDDDAGDEYRDEGVRDDHHRGGFEDDGYSPFSSRGVGVSMGVASTHSGRPGELFTDVPAASNDPSRAVSPQLSPAPERPAPPPLRGPSQISNSNAANRNGKATTAAVSTQGASPQSSSLRLSSGGVSPASPALRPGDKQSSSIGGGGGGGGLRPERSLQFGLKKDKEKLREREERREREQREQERDQQLSRDAAGQPTDHQQGHFVAFDDGSAEASFEGGSWQDKSMDASGRAPRNLPPLSPSTPTTATRTGTASASSPPPAPSSNQNEGGGAASGRSSSQQQLAGKHQSEQLQQHQQPPHVAELTQKQRERVLKRLETAMSECLSDERSVRRKMVDEEDQGRATVLHLQRTHMTHLSQIVNAKRKRLAETERSNVLLAERENRAGLEDAEVTAISEFRDNERDARKTAKKKQIARERNEEAARAGERSTLECEEEAMRLGLANEEDVEAADFVRVFLEGGGEIELSVVENHEDERRSHLVNAAFAEYEKFAVNFATEEQEITAATEEMKRTWLIKLERVVLNEEHNREIVDDEEAEGWFHVLTSATTSAADARNSVRAREACATELRDAEGLVQRTAIDQEEETARAALLETEEPREFTKITAAWREVIAVWMAPHRRKPPPGNPHDRLPQVSGKSGNFGPEYGAFGFPAGKVLKQPSRRRGGGLLRSVTKLADKWEPYELWLSENGELSYGRDSGRDPMLEKDGIFQDIEKLPRRKEVPSSKSAKGRSGGGKKPSRVASRGSNFDARSTRSSHSGFGGGGGGTRHSALSTTYDDDDVDIDLSWDSNHGTDTGNANGRRSDFGGDEFESTRSAGAASSVFSSVAPQSYHGGRNGRDRDRLNRSGSGPSPDDAPSRAGGVPSNALVLTGVAAAHGELFTSIENVTLRTRHRPLQMRDVQKVLQIAEIEVVEPFPVEGMVLAKAPRKFEVGGWRLCTSSHEWLFASPNIEQRNEWVARISFARKAFVLDRAVLLGDGSRGSHRLTDRQRIQIEESLAPIFAAEIDGRFEIESWENHRRGLIETVERELIPAAAIPSHQMASFSRQMRRGSGGAASGLGSSGNPGPANHDSGHGRPPHVNGRGGLASQEFPSNVAIASAGSYASPTVPSKAGYSAVTSASSAKFPSGPASPMPQPTSAQSQGQGQPPARGFHARRSNLGARGSNLGGGRSPGGAGLDDGRGPGDRGDRTHAHGHDDHRHLSFDPHRSTGMSSARSESELSYSSSIWTYGDDSSSTSSFGAIHHVAHQAAYQATIRDQFAQDGTVMWCGATRRIGFSSGSAASPYSTSERGFGGRINSGSSAGMRDSRLTLQRGVSGIGNSPGGGAPLTASGNGGGGGFGSALIRGVSSLLSSPSWTRGFMRVFHGVLMFDNRAVDLGEIADCGALHEEDLKLHKAPINDGAAFGWVVKTHDREWLFASESGAVRDAWVSAVETAMLDTADEDRLAVEEAMKQRLMVVNFEANARLEVEEECFEQLEEVQDRIMDAEQLLLTAEKERGVDTYSDVEEDYHAHPVPEAIVPVVAKDTLSTFTQSCLNAVSHEIGNHAAICILDDSGLPIAKHGDHAEDLAAFALNVMSTSARLCPPELYGDGVARTREDLEREAAALEDARLDALAAGRGTTPASKSLRPPMAVPTAAPLTPMSSTSASRGMLDRRNTQTPTPSECLSSTTPGARKGNGGKSPAPAGETAKLHHLHTKAPPASFKAPLLPLEITVESDRRVYTVAGVPGQQGVLLASEALLHRKEVSIHPPGSTPQPKVKRSFLS